MAIDVKNIRTLVSDLLSKYKIPSAQIGVLYDGQITDLAVGISDITTKEPATVETIYQCGSMTKAWTAVTFMQLIDEGKVDLDEPVRTYLPDFKVADPDVSARVTPRHLLNHTNGIEEDFGNPGEDDDVYERMIKNIANAQQVFPLGYTHGYSAALGYAILARIMEVVDDRRWDEIMKVRLFDRMGLASTGTWREQVDRAAKGHIIRSLDEGPLPSPMAFLPRSYSPGGNISSTAREVLMMAQLFLNEGMTTDGKRIISAAAIREMMQSRVPIPDPYMFGPWWALGLIVCDWSGEIAYAHDGSTIGQNARLRILPDSNIAISMMTNGGPRESFYKKVFNEILSNLGATTIPDLPTPDPKIKLELSRYAGVYGRPGVRYEVEPSGDELFLAFERNPMEVHFLGKPECVKYRLLPIDETHFLMPSADPLEDTQTVAIYDFSGGAAQYLHTNSRVHPRLTNRSHGDLAGD